MGHALSDAAIKITRLSKTFASCKALDSVNLEIRPGEMVALIGSSGSGKSTLLRLVAGLACGDSEQGSIEVFGRPVQTCGHIAHDIRRTRARIGFIFQQFNLVGRLCVMTNVLTGTLGRLPTWRRLCGSFPTVERHLAREALERVGIADKAWQRTSSLSGGQQQRAAIARSLVQKAQIILADEPIASLDPESSRRVMEVLARINAEDGVTVVVSLHQVDFALRYCPRTVALRQGKIVHDGPSSALTPQLLRSLYGSEAAELGLDAEGPSYAPGFGPDPALAALS